LVFSVIWVLGLELCDFTQVLLDFGDAGALGFHTIGLGFGASG
jgi:hypothetical protein